MTMSYDEPKAPDPAFTPDTGRAPKWRNRWLAGAVALAALGGFAGIVWYAYDLGIRAGSESVAPLIKAEEGPAKIRPEEPGGMEVPYQDKLVYDRLAPDQAEPPAERLLPPPEAPLPPPQAAEPPPPEAPLPPPQAAEPPPPVAAPLDSAGVQVPEPPPPSPLIALIETEVPKSDVPPPLTAGIETAAPEAVQTPPAPEVAASQEAAPAKEAESVTDLTAAPAESYRVQVAAMRSSEAAYGGWQRLQAQHKDLLGKLKLTVQRVDLGPEKGVFYRVQAGPLADRAAARDLCTKLSLRRVGCLIVRP